MGAVLLSIYERLFAHYGDLHWWPARTPYEVIVGAVLTQNTAWVNVEKAIARFGVSATQETAAKADGRPACTSAGGVKPRETGVKRKAIPGAAEKDASLGGGATQEAAAQPIGGTREVRDGIGGGISPERVAGLPVEELADIIRPAGFFNQKAVYLKAVTEWFGQYGYDVGEVQKQPLGEVRAKLLRVKGIGEETADSILLYAFGFPTFVVDAYTIRLCERYPVEVKYATDDGHHTGQPHQTPFDRGETESAVGGTAPYAIKPRNGSIPGDGYRAGRGGRYAAVQAHFEAALPPDAQVYNHFHALIVENAKGHCRKKPICGGCPLFDGCGKASAATSGGMS
ncbi:MAG: hypothetical protein LBR77_03645 [Lachnospiraceae bacterium]|jgi:endonuclease-3 related protein|nr:hypothetical protein [Lachnospiraceae bacterium]